METADKSSWAGGPPDPNHSSGDDSSGGVDSRLSKLSLNVNAAEFVPSFLRNSNPEQPSTSNSVNSSGETMEIIKNKTALCHHL